VCQEDDLVLLLAGLMIRAVVSFPFIPLLSLSWVDGQLPTPTQNVPLPHAIYSPQPIYRAEWAKQGVTDKGIVLVMIDPKTGIVTGVRMLQSSGSEPLDGAVLKAYSKWRFKPGSAPQVKMPIEFTSRLRPQPSKQAQQEPAILYILLIFLGFSAAVTVMSKRKTSR
jgi:TonB family protein